jgi:cytochrome c oxidase assembly factor CtaG
VDRQEGRVSPLWHWHPSVVAGLLGLLIVYAAAVGRPGRLCGLRPRGVEVGRGQRAAFVGGTGALAVALLGPIAEWAEHVALSAHMAQHLLLTMVAPPLWLLGTPGFLLAPLLRVPGVAPAGHLLTRPVVALGLAGTALVVWHFPVFFEAALAREPVHVLEHLTLLATGVLAWWPVAGQLPAWPRPAPPARLLYLFLSTIPMMAVASPITMAEEVLYPFYQRAGAAWPLSPRADQELAGVLMWIGGSFGYLVAGTIVFFRWARDEDPERGAAPLVGGA